MKAQHMRLLAFIRSYIERHGYGPSFMEMRRFEGGNSAVVTMNLIDTLDGLGLIRRLYGKARAIEVCKPSMAFLPVAIDIAGNAFIDASQARPLALVD